MGEEAETPPTTFSTEVEVRVVEVPVVVTDRERQPVLDLDRDDFELRVDGRPVEIEYFRAPRARAQREETADRTGAAAGAERAAGAGPSREGSGPAPLHLLIYLEETFAHPADLVDVDAAVSSFLATGLPGEARVRVVVANGSLRPVGGWVPPGLAVDTWRGLRHRPGRGLVLESDYYAIVRDIDRLLALLRYPSLLTERRAEALAREIDAATSALLYEASDEVTRSVERSLAALELFAGVEGRRAMLHIGGRFPLDLAEPLREIRRAPFGPGARGSSGSRFAEPGEWEVLAPSLRSDPRRLLGKLAEEAAARGVVVYGLDVGTLRLPAKDALAAGGLSSTTGTRRGYAESQRAAHHAELEHVAGETGGLALVGSRDFAGALARIEGDLDEAYSLGFTPRRLAPGSHELEVRTTPKRRGWRVRHRESFRPRTADDIAWERVAQALRFPDAQPLVNPLGARLAPTDSGCALVVPAESLEMVAEGSAARGQLTLFLGLRGRDGSQALGPMAVPLVVEPASGLSGLDHRLLLPSELSSGRGRLVAGLRDDLSRRFAIVAAAIPECSR